MTNSRFTLLNQIGVGGMGVIWRAYDTHTGAIVAVKKLHSHLARQKDRVRFVREIEILQSIRHPNVIRITAVLDSADGLGYAMEYCPDGNLDTWLSQSPATRNILKCFRELVEGVAALHGHELKIAHRDLKPTNVLLGADGRFKISDLGLSLALSGKHQRVTTSNWVSEGFSPPEQHRDMASVDRSGDVYSLGAILHYMLTGRDCSTRPQLPSKDIPNAISPVLRWCLMEDSAKRPQTAADVRDILRWALNQTRYRKKHVSLETCQKCGGPSFEVDKGDGVQWRCMSCGDCGEDYAS